nr:MAG TPA: hypothetical protein [Caudoviricetes sp.]
MEKLPKLLLRLQLKRSHLHKQICLGLVTVSVKRRLFFICTTEAA